MPQLFNFPTLRLPDFLNLLLSDIEIIRIFTFTMKTHCYMEVVASAIDIKLMQKPGNPFVVGFATSAMGRCFVAQCHWGICALSFVEEESATLSDFEKSWPNANVLQDDSMAQLLVDQFFGLEKGHPISVCLYGTPFQNSVWQALLTIPAGQVVAYGDVASMIGSPQAVRAVASAIAANRVGLLIPCHRVVRKGGAVGQFRWGTERKAALIEWERGHASSL